MDNQTHDLLEWTTADPRHQDSDWIQGLERIYVYSQSVFAVASIAIGFLGIVGNLFILRGYAKKGFLRHEIHMSFMVLAVSDLCCVLSTMAAGVFSTSSFNQHFTPETIDRVRGIVAGLPHLAFSRTTSIITAWISLKRCLTPASVSRAKLAVPRRSLPSHWPPSCSSASVPR